MAVYHRYYEINHYRDNHWKKRATANMKGLSTHKPNSHDPYCRHPKVPSNRNNNLTYIQTKHNIDKYIRERQYKGQQPSY